MKKLFTLLLVLTGMVTTANAWTGTVRGSFNSWSDSANPFIGLGSWEMYAKLPGSIIHEGAITFKPYIDGKGYRGPKGQSSDYTLATDGITYYGTDQDAGTLNFVIAQNANAKDIYVHVKTYDDGKNDWWEVKVLVVENYTSYTINYTDNDSWSNVYAYATYSSIPLVNSWPGTQMTDGTVTLNALPGSNVIFNNNSGSQYGGFDLVCNGNYDKNGLQSVTATVSSDGYGTFSCVKPLNFSGSAITAHIITAASVGNTVTASSALSSVPANTGLLLQGTGGNYNIPVIGSSDTDVSGNMLKPGTGATVAQSDGSTYNYILTKNTVDNANADMKFYLINDAGNVVPVGKAYLQITSTSAPAFFNIDFGANEINGINKVQNSEAKVNGYYNLNGQRVAQPTKGLYIVNGKKVIIK